MIKYIVYKLIFDFFPGKIEASCVFVEGQLAVTAIR